MSRDRLYQGWERRVSASAAPMPWGRVAAGTGWAVLLALTLAAWLFG